MMVRIKWAAQAIAQPCQIQKQLFPVFVNVADELALEWESALDELGSLEINTLLSNQQKTAIEILDSYMLSISGSYNIQYWNDEALCHAVEWENMRKLASDLLTEMKWERVVPPSVNDRIYINGS